jgi:cytochrome c oxidase subunit 2
MQVLSRFYGAAILAVIALLGAGAAWAGIGQPSDWQIGPQDPVTPVADQIVGFHTYLLVWISLITAFVLALLVYVVLRFNSRANPTPSRTTHNTLIEVVWTLGPVLILLSIAIPSFKYLFFQLNTPKADLTVKATGQQWFWTYTYPDAKLEFSSNILSEKERAAKLAKDPKADVPRLLAVDNELVVPVNKVVRVQTTGAEVIHAWAVPSFGVKIDAIPGRLNETWFKAEREGVYYGQCSELCGKNHAFMPIMVRVVSEQAFAAWLTDAATSHPDWKVTDEGSARTRVAAGQD